MGGLTTSTFMGVGRVIDGGACDGTGARQVGEVGGGAVTSGTEHRVVAGGGRFVILAGNSFEPGGAGTVEGGDTGGLRVAVAGEASVWRESGVCTGGTTTFVGGCKPLIGRVA